MSTQRDEVIDGMLANPTAHGFDWEYGPLHKGGMELTKSAPFIKHLDTALMQKHFGDSYFLDSANGQSARVRDQRVLREAIWDDKSVASDDEAQKRLVLAAALGRKATRRVTIVEREVIKRIYMADDGTEFENKDEFMEYQAELRSAE